MRILHTSDWHLGRNFGQVPLAADQAAFAAWLLDVVDAEGIDLVVIAGDLFDRAIPPLEAVTLLGDTLRALAERGVKVAAIAGNHDSPDRVAAADGLTDAAGVLIRGGYDRAGLTVTMSFADGPLDIVAVPYLDPVLAPAEFRSRRAEFHAVGPPTPRTSGGTEHAESSRLSHQAVLNRALARRTKRAPRAVAIAHAFVAGGTETDSERALAVGDSPRIATTTFEGFDYVALGHLHRPQAVGMETRRYSGSPLPYSFSEAHAKQVVIVDLAPDGTATVTELPIPVGRPVATITGAIDELLVSPQHAGHEQHFVRAVLRDAAHVLDAKARLLTRFPYVTEIVVSPQPSAERPTAAEAGGRAELSPLAAATAFWADVTDRDPDPDERQLLAALLDEARAAEVLA